MIDEYEAIQRLSLHEGVRLHPYRCTAGKLTIGVGRNLEANPITSEEAKILGRKDVSKGITRQEAMFLLRNDLKKTVEICKNRIPYFHCLDDERQYVLVDMTFNLGFNRLLLFKKMLSYIGTGCYKHAAAELLNSNYAKQVGTRAERLARTLETGKWHL